MVFYYARDTRYPEDGVSYALSMLVVRCPRSLWCVSHLLKQSLHGTSQPLDPSLTINSTLLAIGNLDESRGLLRIIKRDPSRHP